MGEKQIRVDWSGLINVLAQKPEAATRIKYQ
jgi:hypothetical protein